jgi:AcrR family transcriptional regulator
MPYSPKQKRNTREKILESARRLFNRRGYSRVSIEEIMSDAGLTHGGFYRHFTGKDELYAAAVRQFLCKKTPAVWQKRREPSAVTKPRAQRIVDAYFSRAHFDDHDGCCPLLGTASDVERAGEAVKAAYQEVVEQMVNVFEDNLAHVPAKWTRVRRQRHAPINESGARSDSAGMERAAPRARDRALALVALCVGGMVLARNVSDPDLADDFRRTAHAQVRRTAGWI